MPKHRIRITQVFKAIRTIEIEVDAADEYQATEEVASGDIDMLDFDDPRWKTGWDLQNEEVEPA